MYAISLPTPRPKSGDRMARCRDRLPPSGFQGAEWGMNGEISFSKWQTDLSARPANSRRPLRARVPSWLDFRLEYAALWWDGTPAGLSWFVRQVKQLGRVALPTTSLLCASCAQRRQMSICARAY